MLSQNKLAAEKQRKDGKDVQVFSLKGYDKQFVSHEWLASVCMYVRYS